MKTPSLDAQCVVPSPLGPITLAATARGLALAWFDAQAHRSDTVQAPVDATHPHLALAAQELGRYWSLPMQPFSVPLDPQGTDFQRAVWRALCGIAPGAVSSYGAIAQQVGRPRAARAVGAAIGRNPIGIIVPCHRVVGAQGSLTGYAGGLHRKEALLTLEGALLT
jgi:methylated-DNA-[protein]-cysteine S-methyltransferase